MTLPTFHVDGHTHPNIESDLASDGQFPPFMIFVPAQQDYLPCIFRTRVEAEGVCASLNSAAADWAAR